MLNLKFLLAGLFLTNSLFAINQNDKINTNKETIKLTKEEIFTQDSKKTIKELLLMKKVPNSFLKKSTLTSYYKNFDNTLIWSDENGIKNISLSLLETIKNDPVLKPNVKKAFNLDKILKELTKIEKQDNQYTKSMAKIDFMLTSIYDKYMNYLSKGYINWRGFKEELKKLDEKEEILADWEKHNAKKNYIKLLRESILKQDLNIAFNEVNFTYPKAKELSNIILEFEKIAENGGYIKLPAFKTLREGDFNPVIKTIRKRLLQSKDLKEDKCNLQANITPRSIPQRQEDEPVLIQNNINELETICYESFDKGLKDAVISFQNNHGLKADGVIGPITRKYLNISVESKIAKIRLNLERMRWLPRSLGKKFLLVNIPDYKLKMYENDEVKLDMKIVVGTRKNPTPIFSHEMSFVVLNPYWRIPQRIVEREIIPKLIENPNYLNGKGINIHENWDHKSTQFDLNTIDWSLYDETRVATTSIVTSFVNGEEVQTQQIVEPPKGPTMRFIQIPSDKNPLGRMKFMFPNKYAVYLHDTPAKRYFNYTKRAYSHGCVRLAEPKELLKAISLQDENLDFEKASDILNDIEKKQIGLQNKIPVHMVYLTSWVDENNNIQFRDDVYKYDRMQKKFLYKTNKYM